MDASKNSALQGVKKKKNKNNKNNNKHKNPNAQNPPTNKPKPQPVAQSHSLAAASGSKKRRGGSVLEQMRQKLQGGQFRWLNEQLYTTEGNHALDLMKKNPELYEKYHQGRSALVFNIFLGF